VALAGTGQLPEIRGLPGGDCAAFYLAERLWIVGGARSLHLDADVLLKSSGPVDMVLDWDSSGAQIRVPAGEPVSVSLSSVFDEAAEVKTLQPGTHTYSLKPIAPVDLQSALRNLTVDSGVHHANPAAPNAPQSGFTELWRRQVQDRPAHLLRPFRVHAELEPDTMALHNVHDGVLWTSSIPAPVWRVPELVLTVEPPDTAASVTGLRLIGNVGRIEIEELQADDAGYRPVPFEETQEMLFAGYSDNRVGGRLYKGRRLSFTATGSKLRLRLFATDPDAPSVHVGEVQLLGPRRSDGVWGRLLLDRLTPNADSILFCRTGTMVDTLEKGGMLQAFRMDGIPLWKHHDSAPSQYREKYWCTGDTDGDGDKELVTYADDMIVRVLASDGQMTSVIDLHAWEEARQHTSIGHLTYGGKSIRLWPVRADGRPDLFVFGHVHHHQIRFGAEPAIIRRDRVPTIDCAPAASAVVRNWSGTGKQNLIGVAPYHVGVVLWEAGEPGAPPKLVAQQPFAKPLVQPSANNQQPVFVECLHVGRPDGIIAVTPRGVQFFAKPDLKPGWVFAGMCPISAAAVVPQAAAAPDRILVGRENGRLIVLDADSGAVRAERLLDGTVRRVWGATGSNLILAATTRELMGLDGDLRPVARREFAVEDMVVDESAERITVFAVARDGELAAFAVTPTGDSPQRH